MASESSSQAAVASVAVVVAEKALAMGEAVKALAFAAMSAAKLELRSLVEQMQFEFLARRTLPFQMTDEHMAVDIEADSKLTISVPPAKGKAEALK